MNYKKAYIKSEIQASSRGVKKANAHCERGTDSRVGVFNQKENKLKCNSSQDGSSSGKLPSCVYLRNVMTNI